MKEKETFTMGYAGTGTDFNRSDSVPILPKGIGTRISALADALGTRRFAAETAHVSVDSLQRYIREDNMPPFDAAARLCLAAGARLEWLATGEGPMLAAEAQAPNQSQVLDEAALKTALELVEEALEGRKLAPVLRAELIGHVYDLVVAPGELPTASITHLIRAASGEGSDRTENQQDARDPAGRRDAKGGRR